MARFIDLEVFQVTITNGTSVSPGFALGAKDFHALVMPAAWTAASITFQVSHDGGTTWNEFLDQNGNPVTIASVAAAAGQTIAVNRDIFRASNMFKLRSGTVGVPVAQGADRVLGIAMRSTAA